MSELNDTLDLAQQAVPPGPPSPGNARFYVQGGTIFLQTAPPVGSTRYQVLTSDGGGTFNAPNPLQMGTAGTILWGSDNLYRAGAGTLTTDGDFGVDGLHAASATVSGAAQAASLSVSGTATAGRVNVGTLVPTLGAPASGSAVGIVGQLQTDGTFLYLATGTATWLRMGTTFGTF